MFEANDLFSSIRLCRECICLFPSLRFCFVDKAISGHFKMHLVREQAYHARFRLVSLCFNNFLVSWSIICSYQSYCPNYCKSICTNFLTFGILALRV